MLKRVFQKAMRFLANYLLEDHIFDSIVEKTYLDRVERSRNPLNRYGMKAFSQADEDGIIAEICRRLELRNGTFCEYGVGDGLECNTIALAAMGWRGFWISAEKLAFSLDGISPSTFRFYETWVTSSNVSTLFKQGCDDFQIQDVDVLSFDLDGNDLHFVKRLLEGGARPKLYVVEYNAKFIPPARWTVPLDDTRTWNQTDFMGASLQSFVDVFEEHRYKLVCCNAHTGVNAFFVDAAYAAKFEDVPTEISDIFQTVNYKLLRAYGHPKDPRTVQEVFRRNNHG